MDGITLLSRIILRSSYVAYGHFGVAEQVAEPS